MFPASRLKGFEALAMARGAAAGAVAVGVAVLALAAARPAHAADLEVVRRHAGAHDAASATISGIVVEPPASHVSAMGLPVVAEAPPGTARLRAELARRARVTARRAVLVRVESDLAAVLQRSRLVLAPHREATGSYSITLPIAAGRAVVASDLACFREIAEEGQCAVLVPADHAAELAREIGRLLLDPVALSGLEARAREYAAQRTWDAAAERTVAVYEQVLQEGEAR